MAIERRQFLVMGAAFLAGAPRLHAAASDTAAAFPGTLFASSVKQVDGTYAVVVLDEAGQILQTIPLAGRGHDICQSPSGETAVAFARRPGTFAVAFDPTGRRGSRLIQARADRHFYGHGVFSADGKLLYATENDFDNARGVLGVYDVAAGFIRIGELETFGVGPHDLLLLDDGRTLCVANGGIETHPAAGRVKLNLASMRPSLAFIDRETGDLLARHEVEAEIHRLSLRHLCPGTDGRVWFGGQWEGSLDQAPSLVGYVGRDTPIRFCKVHDGAGVALKGYIGSVAMSRDGRFMAASAPRAGRTIFIDTKTGTRVAEAVVKDGCGVAARGADGFLISSGIGGVRQAEPRRRGATEAGDVGRMLREGVAPHFDNHLVALTG